mgnify:CR=1 FL=1
MKISLNWIRDYVQLTASVEEISRAITFLGFEVEQIIRTGAPKLSHVVVGEVLVRDGLVKHLSFVIFLVALFIANIALVYYFENTAREKVKLQNGNRERLDEEGREEKPRAEGTKGKEQGE